MASLLRLHKSVYLTFLIKEMNRIKGTQIKNLITKFYYKDNHLCFQILIHCEDDKTIVYNEYTDYSEYKKEYSKLLETKSENTFVNLPKTGAQSTNMSFV
jgi:hypothetical protein